MTGEKLKPLVILKCKGQLSADAAAHLWASWENAAKGTRFEGKAIVLEDGLDVEVLGEPDPPKLDACPGCGAIIQTSVCEFCGMKGLR